MIPKTIHQIWLGPKKRPARLMDSWAAMHPEWEHRVWTEADIPSDMVNRDKLEQIEEWAGKADILRYEVLLRHGGVYCDADSLCVKRMDDWLLERECFAVFENEQVVPGLVANGYIGAEKGCALMGHLIEGIRGKEVSYAKTGRMAWQNVGPVHFTQTIIDRKYPIDVFPSWMFIPVHHSGVKHTGPEEPYCHQYWGSTQEIRGKDYYNELE